MTDLKRRLRPLDGFDPSMSWEEVRGRGMRTPLGAPARPPRRRIAVIAAALLLSVVSFAWLSTAFREPDRTMSRSGGDTYVFSDIDVGPSTRDPGRIQVGFHSSWSGAEYPGEHRCEFTVTDASGAVIAQESVILASSVPSGGDRSVVDMAGEGDPAAATISCSPERLDTPVAFEIEDVWLQPKPFGILMSYTAAAPAGVEERSYPGTNACTAWIEYPNRWRVEHSFTLTVPPGSRQDLRFDDGQVREAVEEGQLDWLRGGVDCHPFGAADAEGP